MEMSRNEMFLCPSSSRCPCDFFLSEHVCPTPHVDVARWVHLPSIPKWHCWGSWRWHAGSTYHSLCVPNFRKAFLAYSQSTVEKMCMAHPAKLLLSGILQIANLFKTEMTVGCTVPTLFPGFLYGTTNQVWLQSYSVCTPQTINTT